MRVVRGDDARFYRLRNGDLLTDEKGIENGVDGLDGKYGWW